jgi:hypothetical protein
MAADCTQGSNLAICDLAIDDLFGDLRFGDWAIYQPSAIGDRRWTIYFGDLRFGEDEAGDLGKGSQSAKSSIAKSPIVDSQRASR